MKQYLTNHDVFDIALETWLEMRSQFNDSRKQSINSSMVDEEEEKKEEGTKILVIIKFCSKFKFLGRKW